MLVLVSVWVTFYYFYFITDIDKITGCDMCNLSVRFLFTYI